jgi:DNA-binding winged helix-turn-helix (wHTH) protein
MVYELENARLDVSRRQVVRDGREQHLSPKGFQLLMALLEGRPGVISKSDLMHKLWPDTFVSEANLAVLIAEVRAAIGDSARIPRAIKTHHRVGYSFVGDVLERLQPAPESESSTRILLRIGRRRFHLAPGTSTVGRDQLSEIVLTDPSVSRHHARLSVRGGQLRVEDLNSKNGTRIGARRLSEPTVVKDGEIVIFGKVKAIVIYDDSDDLPTESLDEAD